MVISSCLVPVFRIGAHISLIEYFFRALGQGAFGEVYQGLFKKSQNGEVKDSFLLEEHCWIYQALGKSDHGSLQLAETAVAVKTLPELSTNQGTCHLSKKWKCLFTIVFQRRWTSWWRPWSWASSSTQTSSNLSGSALRNTQGQLGDDDDYIGIFWAGEKWW